MNNINKQYQHATRLIQRFICITHLLLIDVIAAENFCLRKHVCCSQVSLAWKTISFRKEKGNRVKHRQTWQGNHVEDEITRNLNFITYTTVVAKRFQTDIYIWTYLFYVAKFIISAKRYLERPTTPRVYIYTYSTN